MVNVVRTPSYFRHHILMFDDIYIYFTKIVEDPIIIQYIIRLILIIMIIIMFKLRRIQNKQKQYPRNRDRIKVRTEHVIPQMPAQNFKMKGFHSYQKRYSVV